MSAPLQKITRTVVQPAWNLFLRLHVKLMDDRNSGREENFHREFEAYGKKYLNLDIQSFLTLEFKDKSTAWDKSQSIVINQRNIHVIVDGMEKMRKSIYGNQVFAVDKDNRNVIYSQEVIDEHTVRIYNLGSNQRIVIKPAIIMDDADQTYEGVLLYINNTNNVIELAVDAFDSLYYTLKNIDIFVYSQTIVNYYAACVESGKIKIEEKKEEPTKVKKHPLTVQPKKEESPPTTSTLPQNKEQFFGIKTD